MLAKMDANKKEMRQDNTEKFKIPQTTLVSKTDAHQEAPKECLGKTEARTETGHEQTSTEIKTDLEELEANPEEMEAILSSRRSLTKRPPFTP
jgi:hypothetical protein